MKKYMFIGALIFFGNVTAQVGIGTITPDPSSILDITSSNQGVLVPRLGLIDVSNTTTPIASPVAGLLIWNTNASVTGGGGIGFYFYNGAQWTMISTAGSGTGTLDESYDGGGAGAGRTIDATDGPVAIDGEDGIKVTGTFNSGDAIVNETGSRLFFNPRKAAFRAGSTVGSQWSNTFVGNYSIGLGNSTTASGEASFASGSFSSASGRYSAAFGRFTQALSYSEFAIGSYATTYTPTNVNAPDPTDRAFVIGNSTTTANRSNAFEVWKDGRVIINEAYTLPTADGTSGQVLETDGSGSTFWSTVASSGVPAGAIFAFPTATAPTGYLVCDGSAVNRTTYAALFSLIGVTYGNGNGTTTFNLPDYRGQFLRGNDSGAGTDPDAISRLDRGDGTTGDNVGTAQGTANQIHVHSVNPPSVTSNSAGNHLHTHSSINGTTFGTGNHGHSTTATSVVSTSDGNHAHEVYYRRNDDMNFSNPGPGTDINEVSSAGGSDGNGDTSTEGMHTHTVDIPAIATNLAGSHAHAFNTGSFNSLSAGTHNHTTNIPTFNSAATGGNESRPTNISVLWCIKF